ncbi:MAG: pyrimidine dimer DNA glycosylase/endonuclease V [Verrucomicrobia bacterium]|nr:pyrimidine dimer DNA glycosylase/endonuclease V [Verrucomicrobiota bacterium]MDA1067651.1 pyrimidine dimer DNA glycosylase/endonuclease V [Verrucomicrobiota bacterium]
MRLWSLHPKYLDSKGIVALWREALLAQKVLDGKTKGYRNHPQLDRFKDLKNPVSGLATYLLAVSNEASVRGYHFDSSKILKGRVRNPIPVHDGQLKYEWNHLKKKLWIRDRSRYLEFKSVDLPDAHSIFKMVPGDIEPWEVV